MASDPAEIPEITGVNAKNLTLAHRVLRTAWPVLFVVLVLSWAASIPSYYRQQLVEPSAAVIFDTTAEVVAAREAAGLSPEGYAFYQVLVNLLGGVVLFIPISLIIYLYRRDDRGALTIATLLLFIGTGGGIFQPSAVIGYPWPALRPIIQLSQFLSTVAVTALFYIFPDGRFVPRWTRLLLLLFAITYGLNEISAAFGASLINTILGVAFIITFIGSQIYRYRRVAGPVERGQIKWAMFGLLAWPLAWTMQALISPLIATANPGDGLRLHMLVTLFLWTFLFNIMPIGIGIAILRYRLYDIDVIIRRTTSYAVITGLLALVYFGSIVILQRLLTPLTGESDVAVVLSTLLIYFLFSPIRRRVQNAIDRRFYRRKYDAEKTIQAFADTVRNEADLDKLTAELLRVIQETMEPEHVSIWLKPVEKREIAEGPV
jgi:hypothetical protein